MISSTISITVAAAVLLLIAIITLTTRRVRSNNRFELGSVSQQWLIGHRGDER